MKSADFIKNHNQSSPDFTLSLYKTEADFAKLAEISMAQATLPWAFPGLTTEEFHQNFKNLINCDLTRDLLIVEEGNHPVAYFRVSWQDTAAVPERLFSVGGRMNPSIYGKGVHELMLNWAFVRIHELSLEHPTDRLIMVNHQVNQRDLAQLAVVKSMGFTPRHHYFEMRRDLENIPSYSLPEGLTVRPAFQHEYQHVFNQGIDAFRDHYGFAESWANYQEWLEEPQFQPWLWQLAWHGNENIGQVLNYIEHGENERTNHLRGYTENISVIRKWRSKGIAKALVCRSMEMFKALGMKEVALFVDASSPTGALHLYENLGYQVFKTMVDYVKPLQDESFTSECAACQPDTK